MKFRERERFIKLRDCDLDDCKPGESGWLTTNELEGGGAEFTTTTDEDETLRVIFDWISQNKEVLGDITIEVTENGYTFVREGVLVPFDEVMEIINEFR